MNEIHIDLSANAHDADRRNNESTVGFDAAVADLSGIATLVGDTNAGERYVEDYASRMLDAINSPGRYDEAFGFAVENGNGALLPAMVVEHAANRGELRLSADILENVSSGFENWRDTVDARQERVDELNTQLSGALGYATLLPEDQFNASNDAHFDRYSDDYGARDAGIERLFTDANILDGTVSRLPPDLQDPELGVHTNTRGRQAMDRVDDVVVSTFIDERLQRGVEESGALVSLIDMQLNSEKPSIFDPDRLVQFSLDAEDPDATTEVWLDTVFNSQVAAAAAQSAAGDSDAASDTLDNLAAYEALIQNPALKLAFGEGLSALQSVIMATDEQEATEGLENLDSTLVQHAETLGEGLDASEKLVTDPVFEERFASAGIALTIASLGTRAPEVLTNGDFNSRLNLGADAGQLYVALAEQSGNITPGLVRFGNMLGVVKVGVEIAYFPSDGSATEQALATASIVGQLGVVASVPFAGWVAGAAAGGLLLYQYLDVTDDNPGARDLLIDGGFDPELADAFTQYDVNGYSGAFAIQAGIATHLGLSQEQARSEAGTQAVYEYLQQLTPAQANDYALAAQGLVPQRVEDRVAESVNTGVSIEELTRRYDRDGDGIYLPSGSDEYPVSDDVEAIREYNRNFGEPNSTNVIPTPESIIGLESWIDAYGLGIEREYFPEPSQSVQGFVEAAQREG